MTTDTRRWRALQLRITAALVMSVSLFSGSLVWYLTQA